MSAQLEILWRMVDAMHATEAVQPFESEMRMHPDDIEALRRQCGTAKTTGPVNSWAGIKIIPDESTERLPRKAT